MTILDEAKRIKTGESLSQFKTQAINVVNQIKGIKANLTNLKTQLQSDTKLYESADVAEIDTIMDFINTEIGKI